MHMIINVAARVPGSEARIYHKRNSRHGCGFPLAVSYRLRRRGFDGWRQPHTVIVIPRSLPILLHHDFSSLTPHEVGLRRTE